MFRQEIVGKATTIDDVFTEEDLKLKFGLSENQIKRMRTKEGLPFVRMGHSLRAYFEDDIVRWLRDHVIVLNQHEMRSEDDPE